MGRVRAVVWYRAAADEEDALNAVFAEVAGRLRGTPGLVRLELLRSTADPDGFAVMGEWESMEVFREWERRTEHAPTRELRPYLHRDRKGGHWDLLQVEASGVEASGVGASEVEASG